MPPDAKRVRAAYERHRVALALPWVVAGAVGAACAAWCGATAWPMALLAGVGAAIGRFVGRDVGSGLVVGAAVGGLGAAGLLCYSLVGCCGDACGPCGWVCGAAAVAVGLAVGAWIRRSPAALAGALPTLMGTLAVGLSATLSAPTPLLLTATTAAGVWLLVPPRTGSR